MNTNQKLTLGIAAIFMVTLTIVGVTYAYFVTRVTGETSESINIQAAQVGSVKYVAGNGESDTITLEKVVPGTTLYKTFAVTNDSEDEGSYGSYTIYLESFATSGKAQFVHATTDTDCYKSTAVPSNSSEPEPTEACFDAAEYNNVYITLYEVDNTEYAKIPTDGKNDGEATLETEIKSESKVAAKTGTSDFDRASQDLSSLTSIKSGETKYYVLKVEYKEASTNQNIENEAELSLKVNIK